MERAGWDRKRSWEEIREEYQKDFLLLSRKYGPLCVWSCWGAESLSSSGGGELTLGVREGWVEEIAFEGLGQEGKGSWATRKTRGPGCGM